VNDFVIIFFPGHEFGDGSACIELQEVDGASHQNVTSKF
jgi:hypothetical protein